MITEFANEEYITNVKIYVSKNKALIYMKQRLIEYFKQRNNTHIARNFNTSFSEQLIE